MQARKMAGVNPEAEKIERALIRPGALIFNDLAKDIRDEKSLLRLKSKLRAVNI